MITITIVITTTTTTTTATTTTTTTTTNMSPKATRCFTEWNLSKDSSLQIAQRGMQLFCLWVSLLTDVFGSFLLSHRVFCFELKLFADNGNVCVSLTMHLDRLWANQPNCKDKASAASKKASPLSLFVLLLEGGDVEICWKIKCNMCTTLQVSGLASWGT